MPCCRQQAASANDVKRFLRHEVKKVTEPLKKRGYRLLDGTSQNATA